LLYHDELDYWALPVHQIMLHKKLLVGWNILLLHPLWLLVTFVPSKVNTQLEGMKILGQ